LEIKKFFKAKSRMRMVVIARHEAISFL